MFDWLTICAEGQTTPCIGVDQGIYLVGLVIGVVLLAFIARRSRDLTTATLTLMAVAIAINVAVGSIAVALRLPIYLDSIGTVLVGALAGPWAGAITGILSNVIWSILPIPGGGGPNAAFFAPVAGVIGLMAGFWGGRGVFQLRPDDARVGGFLALATGLAGAVVAYLVLQATIGVTFSFDDVESQNRFVTIGLVIALIGIAVGWISGRTIYRLEGQPERARSYLVWAATIGAAALIFGLVRLVFGPGGYFSAMDGLNDDGAPDGFPNLTSLELADPLDKTISYTIVFFILGALPITMRTMYTRGETTVVE